MYKLNENNFLEVIGVSHNFLSRKNKIMTGN